MNYPVHLTFEIDLTVQPVAALAGVLVSNALDGELGVARVTGVVTPPTLTGGIRERAVTGDVTGDDIEGQVDC